MSRSDIAVEKMDQERLKELIQEGESTEVEFKESLSLRGPIGQAVSGFSNANGGTIIVGLTDSGEIKGVDIGENTVEQLANRIKQHTDPKVYPSINTKNIDGKDVVIIEVNDVQDYIPPSSLTSRNRIFLYHWNYGIIPIRCGQSRKTRFLQEQSLQEGREEYPQTKFLRDQKTC